MATAQSAVSLKRPIKTALHQAVLDCRIHQVRLLVDKHGGNVDSKDVFGRTPLMLACLLDNESYGHKMVRIFMHAGAYLNVKDNLNRTAFHYACMKGRISIVRLLIKEDNVEISIPDNDGNTPLMHAALSGNPDIIKLIVDDFVKFGLSTDDRNGMGYTALLLACKYGHHVSAGILLNEGKAQPTLRDNEFYFNAPEWVHKSKDINASQLVVAACMQRSRTCLSDFPRFSREHTMYNMGNATPVCHHSGNRAHPLGQSLDTALQLPALFSRFTLDKTKESSTMEGQDARQILLKDMEEVMHNPKLRPQSRVSSIFTRSVGSYPGTPKLLDLGPRTHTVMFPDMKTIFRLYGEKHGPRPKDPVAARNFLRYGDREAPRLIREEHIPGIHIQMPTPQAELSEHA